MLVREEKSREETGRLNEKEVTCLEKQSGAGQAVLETTIIAIGLQVLTINSSIEYMY